MASKRRRYVVVKRTTKPPTLPHVPFWTSPAEVVGYVVARTPDEAWKRAHEKFGLVHGKEWFDIQPWSKASQALREAATETSEKQYTGPDDLLAVFDNKGKTADRYTLVFDKTLMDTSREEYLPMLGLSGNPDHPQGVSMWSEGITGEHLGEQIAWADLPVNVRQHVLRRFEEAEEALGDR